ncbi:MAG: ribosomal-processing cysteine protease Prp [Mycoplasmatota bacterium]
MIKIIVEKNIVTIKGHANYDDMGKDIVCASVSSIVITTINAMLLFDESSIIYEINDGFIKLEIIKETKETLVLLENMINMFKQLVKQYKKNINLNIK